MESLTKFCNHAVDVRFSHSALHFTLRDGEEISLPLNFFPKLRDASPARRNNWHFIGGAKIYWPDIDENIIVGTLEIEGEKNNFILFNYCI